MQYTIRLLVCDLILAYVIERIDVEMSHSKFRFKLMNRSCGVIYDNRIRQSYLVDWPIGAALAYSLN